MDNPLVIVAGIMLAIVLSVVDNPMYANSDNSAIIESACQPFTTADATFAAGLPMEPPFPMVDTQP